MMGDGCRPMGGPSAPARSGKLSAGRREHPNGHYISTTQLRAFGRPAICPKTVNIAKPPGSLQDKFLSPASTALK